MGATRRGAGSLEADRKIDAYQGDLKLSVSVLAECAAASDILREQATSADAKMALLDLEDAVDSTLLKLNSNFACVVDAMRNATATEGAARAAVSCQLNREAAAQEAENDLDAIMALYATPLESSLSEEPAPVLNPQNFDSVKLDRYKDFSRVLFSFHDPQAKTPSNKEAIASLLSALQERRVEQEEDDELEVGDFVVKPICLISSKLLEEPVRAVCGHHFSKQYILDAIRRNQGGVTCPSRGCSNVISADQLVRDRLMDLRVHQFLRKEERTKYIESQTVRRVA